MRENSELPFLDCVPNLHQIVHFTNSYVVVVCRIHWLLHTTTTYVYLTSSGSMYYVVRTFNDQNRFLGKLQLFADFKRKNCDIFVPTLPFLYLKVQNRKAYCGRADLISTRFFLTVALTSGVFVLISQSQSESDLSLIQTG